MTDDDLYGLEVFLLDQKTCVYVSVREVPQFSNIWLLCDLQAEKVKPQHADTGSAVLGQYRHQNLDWLRHAWLT